MHQMFVNDKKKWHYNHCISGFQNLTFVIRVKQNCLLEIRCIASPALGLATNIDFLSGCSYVFLFTTSPFTNLEKTFFHFFFILFFWQKGWTAWRIYWHCTSSNLPNEYSNMYNKEDPFLNCSNIFPHKVVWMYDRFISRRNCTY